jgi:hypothetical protein
MERGADGPQRPRPLCRAFVPGRLAKAGAPRILTHMSIETHFLLRKDQPGLRDLDDVLLLGPAVAMTGEAIAAGTEGTVVGVLSGGLAYLVEFPQPMGAIAMVRADMLTLARASDR